MVLETVKRLFSAASGGRRRYSRQREPALEISFDDGAVYETIDWSAGGFLIAGPDFPVRPGKRYGGRVNFPAANASGRFAATVVRSGLSGESGWRWVRIPPPVYRAMAGMEED
ncbi:MAG: PilZ domain-containing protein [Alphaproteobacteria bacterium]|jgi:hypothetical protein|nr:PilZ domain-containing protein [Alphaproteobacteria bacterium]MDP6816077.1 PilZ domain-containing protein [Alphaproteobacteria bacterium]